MTNGNIEAGLSSEKAKELQRIYGRNELTAQNKDGFLKKLLHIISEPMFLLLIAAAIIYFILGEARDGAIMLIFVIGIIAIDAIQEWKTDKTLNALKELSAPEIRVIRDGCEKTIPSAELVPGDLMIICEGVKIPADGVIERCNDLCVDESSLTGEAEGVWKTNSDDAQERNERFGKEHCYAGTLVTQGSALVRVEKTGAETEYGKIGAHVAAAPSEQSPLQKQTGELVKLCAVIAAILFVMVAIFTYMNIPDHAPGERLIESVLSGITLAMAMIPEEFPVILTVFLSMGAWRLAKKNSLVRKLPAVETLGAVSVLCVDKTGTITKNEMSMQSLWALRAGSERELTETMGLACETEAYDPMEKAMLSFCSREGFSEKELFSGQLIGEYAFTNELKMMGHVWQRSGGVMIAAKGSPERILEICDIAQKDAEKVKEKMAEMTAGGLRVIAVAKMLPDDPGMIPSSITGCSLTFLGLAGLSDPPREGVKDDIETCRRAGIRVIMITGDNGLTASAIAAKVGIENGEVVTGGELDLLTDEELCEKVKTASIFSRVAPEHKMRIVKALKQNGEIVAMTGDGVNDAPALKYADIGIAMGKRGSEVSREAADLILMDDNFGTIVETVKDGRRIYDNIRKAVGYVFTIHIPIALSSLLAPFLGISPSSLFLLPLHVVLLELLIDPTCSIVLERQPAEKDIMERKPRSTGDKLLNTRLLIKSVLQGLVIFAASFGSYLYLLPACGAPVARAMGLSVIMLSNILLVQVNSSVNDSAWSSFKRLAGDKVMWISALATLALLLIVLYTPFGGYLKLAALSAPQFFAAAGISAAAVLWYEIVKLIRRKVTRA